MTEEDISKQMARVNRSNSTITAISVRDSDSSTEDITKQIITKSPSIEINKDTMCIKAPSHKLDIEERKKPKFK
tara:strand:+ start:91 stop:312 length:222 start_codon:yes stop_codon:yes gene_type:complete